MGAKSTLVSISLIVTKSNSASSVLEHATHTKSPAEGGKIIFTTLNGLFPLHNSVQEFINDHKQEGNASPENTKFNLMTFRQTAEMTAVDDNGNEMTLQTNERWYMPIEITWLLKTLGFKQVDICGARLGEFSRKHELSVKDFEMLVIAE